MGRTTLLAAILLIVGLAITAGAGPPRIAVFIEEEFPAFGGMPALPPFRIIEALARHGVPAQALSAADLANPARLSVHKVTVLVMPYGNTFPRTAFNKPTAIKYD
jgi:hypothetical protein